MCIMNLVKVTPISVIAYKKMFIDKNGFLYGVRIHQKYEIGKYYKAEEVKNDNIILGASEFQIEGFHCFLDKEYAEDYNNFSAYPLVNKRIVLVKVKGMIEYKGKYDTWNFRSSRLEPVPGCLLADMEIINLEE